MCGFKQFDNSKMNKALDSNHKDSEKAFIMLRANTLYALYVIPLVNHKIKSIVMSVWEKICFSPSWLMLLNQEPKICYCHVHKYPNDK